MEKFSLKIVCPCRTKDQHSNQKTDMILEKSIQFCFMVIIKVYRPFVHPNIAIKDTFSNKDLTLAQEIWVLGEHTLADFRHVLAY